MRNKVLKWVSLFCFVCVLSASHAEELRPPRRLFELGASAQGGLSNNVLQISDFFQDGISATDLLRLNHELTFHFDFGFDFFARLNLPNGWRFGYDAGLESDGFARMKPVEWKFFSKGSLISVGTSGNAYTDAFLYSSFSVSFPLKEKMRLSITPTVFAPVMHLALGEFDLSGSLNRRAVSFDATSQTSVYTSAIDLTQVAGGGKINTQSDLNFGEVVKSLGFDLAAAFELPLPSYEKLQLGGYIRLPIVPGRLLHGSRSEVNFHKELALGDLASEEMPGLLSEFASELSNSTKTDTGKFWISRPFKLGAEAALRPFGSWFTVSGLLGFGVRYPYTKAAKFYLEYNVGLSFLGWNTIGLSLSTGYLNSVFVHEVGLVLNARVVEVNFAISAQDGNFAQSFQGTGLGSRLYVALGVPYFKKKK